MGRSELLAKLAQEASAWDSSSGDLAALLREAKADIEHLAVVAAGHFQQAMVNGERANEFRQDAERYRWLCATLGETQLPTLIERITNGYVADYKPSIDATIDAAMLAAPAVGAA